MAGGFVLLGFSALHWFIAYEHWRQASVQRESVTLPVLFAIVSGGLAFWLFRRALVHYHLPDDTMDTR